MKSTSTIVWSGIGALTHTISTAPPPPQPENPFDSQIVMTLINQFVYYPVPIRILRSDYEDPTLFLQRCGNVLENVPCQQWIQRNVP